MLEDVPLAVRSLRQHPGFSALGISILALGAGANASCGSRIRSPARADAEAAAIGRAVPGRRPCGGVLPCGDGAHCRAAGREGGRRDPPSAIVRLQLDHDDPSRRTSTASRRLAADGRMAVDRRGVLRIDADPAPCGAHVHETRHPRLAACGDRQRGIRDAVLRERRSCAGTRDSHRLRERRSPPDHRRRRGERPTSRARRRADAGDVSPRGAELRDRAGADRSNRGPACAGGCGRTGGGTVGGPERRDRRRVAALDAVARQPEPGTG